MDARSVPLRAKRSHQSTRRVAASSGARRPPPRRRCSRRGCCNRTFWVTPGPGRRVAAVHPRPLPLDAYTGHAGLTAPFVAKHSHPPLRPAPSLRRHCARASQRRLKRKATNKAGGVSVKPLVLTLADGEDDVSNAQPFANAVRQLSQRDARH
jgi:hypothetical protein